MNDQIIEKRNTLRTISNAAIEAAKSFDINPDEHRVNDLIMQFAYDPHQIHAFNTFLGWKIAGYTIKKGAKAYLLWGQPINKTHVNKATGQIIELNDDEKEPPYFPLAYIFRDDQVILSKPQNKTKPEKELKHQTINLEF